ncbi:MAG: hypothetical protein KatS3mg010_0219 [Acidimicrobiia bacterium]|nr:MAG: hypothetical protein KatS3mg010_0219 [Acidimicrobiia bacterium]
MLLVSRVRASRTGAAAALVVAITIAGIASTAPASAAPGDDLAGKRARAEQLQAEIARNGTRISQLDEAYNEARIEIERARAGVAQTQQQLEAASARADDIAARVAGRAARLYMGAGTGGALPTLDVDDVTDLGSRSKYGAAAADHDEQLLDALAAAREDLEAARADFERRRSEAEAERARLADTRDALAAAQAEQEELLAQVEGEIGRLVAEIEAQRRAEEEARARAEFERRAHEAQRRATSTAPARPAAPGTSRPSAPTQGPASPPSPAPAPPPVAAPGPNAQKAVDVALAQLGKPYRYAASGPDAFDCSGLTMFAWAAAGVQLPHSSRAQYASLPKVSQDQLAPGDLVFYGSPIHHVGMYIGGGQYVHAPQTGDVVKVSSIYRRDWAGAARPG